MSARAWSEKYWSDPERAKVLAEEGAVLDAADLITEYMEKNQISRAELARRLRTSKAAVSQALNGGRNMTLRTLGRLAWGLGVLVGFSLTPAKMQSFEKVQVIWQHAQDRSERWSIRSTDGPEARGTGPGVAA